MPLVRRKCYLWLKDILKQSKSPHFYNGGDDAMYDITYGNIIYTSFASHNFIVLHGLSVTRSHSKSFNQKPEKDSVQTIVFVASCHAGGVRRYEGLGIQW